MKNEKIVARLYGKFGGCCKRSFAHFAVTLELQGFGLMRCFGQQNSDRILQRRTGCFAVYIECFALDPQCNVIGSVSLLQNQMMQILIGTLQGKG